MLVPYRVTTVAGHGPGVSLLVGVLREDRSLRSLDGEDVRRGNALVGGGPGRRLSDRPVAEAHQDEGPAGLVKCEHVPHFAHDVAHQVEHVGRRRGLGGWDVTSRPVGQCRTAVGIKDSGAVVGMIVVSIRVHDPTDGP